MQRGHRARGQSGTVHGLPDGFDPEVFVGREIGSVTFAEHAIHISLGTDAGITAECSVHYQLGEQDEQVDLVPPVAASRLMGLVGRKVISASASAAGELVLSLTPEGFLRVADESESFESYTLLTPEGEVHV